MLKKESNLNSVITLSANTCWYLVNFRSALIRRLQADGWRVVIIAPWDAYAASLEAMGCTVHHLPLVNSGTNPAQEMRSIWAYYQIYRRLRPAVALHFTPKANIYGSLAARLARVPCINNIAGLGTAFIQNGWLTRVVRTLYAVSQKSCRKVFFQNPDDQTFFVQHALVRAEQADLLPGSGVNTETFAPVTGGARHESDQAVFLLIARLIWDKGVGEFVEAACLVRQTWPQAQFQLLGFVDDNNPRAVPEARIRAWEREGLVTWLGRSDDVRAHIAAADCVVLPSYYREGTPKSLLEAASMGKPLITTDAVGCRQAVDDGVNGFLCRPRDAEDLAAKMCDFWALSPEKREQMGQKSREKMVREFDERIVLDKYMAAVREIVG